MAFDYGVTASHCIDFLLYCREMKISKEQRELLRSCNITNPLIKDFQTYRARELARVHPRRSPRGHRQTLAHDLARREYAKKAIVGRTVPYIRGHSSFWGAVSYYRRAPSGYLILVDQYHPLTRCPPETFGERTVAAAIDFLETAIADWI